MANINVAQINLLPNLFALFSQRIAPVISSPETDSIIDRLKTLLPNQQNPAFDKSVFDQLVIDVRALISKIEANFGKPAADSPFGQVEAELATFEGTLEAILGGQEQTFSHTPVDGLNGEELFFKGTVARKPVAQG